MCKLFVRNINGSDARSHSESDLHCQMAEPANAEDRQTLSWLDFGVFQRSIDRNTRTKKRRGRNAGKTIRNLQRVARGSFYKLSVSAVHGYARNLLLAAE